MGNKDSSILSKTSSSLPEDLFSQELTEKLQYIMEQGEGIEFHDLNQQFMIPNNHISSNNEIYISNFFQIPQYESSGLQKLRPPSPLDVDLSKTSPGDQILSPAEFDAIFASFSAIAGEPDDCEFDRLSSTSTDDTCALLDDEKLSHAFDSISFNDITLDV
ncbi:20273_t:CDS:2 [Cetraspora pellucida]|uniref:20273_t:CDS:1 n=1 Tax=Cetraspora pellucida TaxID=1433469 RepID=A0A9N9CMC0_9GLOM|nr:20273_t:CDS:2 [Cetraspora pellucida]